MKVKCSQKALASALNIVNKAVSPNNTLPVLNNILVSVEGKKIVFSATNLVIAIKTVIEADVVNEGSITVMVDTGISRSPGQDDDNAWLEE